MKYTLSNLIILSLVNSFSSFILTSSALPRQSKSGRISDLRQTHPITHGLNYLIVAMNTGVDRWGPASIPAASIPTD